MALGKDNGSVVRIDLRPKEKERFKRHCREKLGVSFGRWLADAARKRYEEEKAA